MKLERVIETCLYVDDLDRAARFYEQVLVPAVRAGAVVYVLPDTRPLGEVFPLGRRPASHPPQASAGAAAF